MLGQLEPDVLVPQRLRERGAILAVMGERAVE